MPHVSYLFAYQVHCPEIISILVCNYSKASEYSFSSWTLGWLWSTANWSYYLYKQVGAKTVCVAICKFFGLFWSKHLALCSKGITEGWKVWKVLMFTFWIKHINMGSYSSTYSLDESFSGKLLSFKPFS